MIKDSCDNVCKVCWGEKIIYVATLMHFHVNETVLQVRLFSQLVCRQMFGRYSYVFLS